MGSKSSSIDLPAFTQPKNKGGIAAATPREKASQAVTVQTSRVDLPGQTASPGLAGIKRPSFNHRNDANATLALDLLSDVVDTVTGWHEALRHTLLQIQALYMAGPMIEGWIEAVSPQKEGSKSADDAGILRHGDAAQVAAYIEKIAQAAPAKPALGKTRYRLCQVDAEGNMQCQACPLEQIGAVSQAIARYQQLRQLISQKQYLEARLKGAAEALETTRRTLGITAKASD